MSTKKAFSKLCCLAAILLCTAIVGCSKVKAKEFRNNEYGLAFSLPQTWAGFSVIYQEWEGFLVDEKGCVVQGAETGPKIILRHPEWADNEPRQDIPVMVFSLAQWESLQRDEFHIGAAPVNPAELGRNDSYVFALPARYNYAFPEGYEEVERILESCPLHAFQPAI